MRKRITHPFRHTSSSPRKVARLVRGLLALPLGTTSADKPMAPGQTRSAFRGDVCGCVFSTFPAPIPSPDVFRKVLHYSSPIPLRGQHGQPVGWPIFNVYQPSGCPRAAIFQLHPAHFSHMAMHDPECSSDRIMLRTANRRCPPHHMTWDLPYPNGRWAAEL